jgi:D-lactate dehydrogenase
MKLVFFDAQEGDTDKVKSALPDLEVEVVEGPLDENVGQAADADIVSVFVTSTVKSEEIGKMSNLKLIATRSTGFDHIDLKESVKKEIVVANVPTYGQNTVAEHAFALILALSRKIFQSFEKTEKMDFDREGLEGFDLKGKTLGVVGCGNIGRHSVMIGRGFGMEVLVYDVKADEEFAKETGCTFTDDLDELLEKSEVITLHVPYIPDVTHHLINKDNVKKIKRGAILVNTARGAVVDTEALLWALEDGVLSGAGLDVLEEENPTFDHVELLSKGFPKEQDIATLLRNHILVARDDVIITPHNAFNSTEAKQRIFDTTMGNIKGFVAGKLENTVEVKE